MVSCFLLLTWRCSTSSWPSRQRFSAPTRITRQFGYERKRAEGPSPAHNCDLKADPVVSESMHLFDGPPGETLLSAPILSLLRQEPVSPLLRQADVSDDRLLALLTALIVEGNID